MEQKKKRIMEKFELGEISFVPVPAQTPAIATITKNGDLVNLLTSVSEGHQHGVNIRYDEDSLYLIINYAGSEGENEHDHQVIRTAEGQYIVSENHGHSHELDQDIIRQTLMSVLMKADKNIPLILGGLKLADLPELQKASDNLKEVSMTDELLIKSEERVASLEAELVLMKTINSFDSDQKAYYDSLPDDEKTVFVNKSENDRIDEVAKTKADIVYTADNGDIYKSTDDPRLVNMAKERDTERKENIRLRKAAEEESFENIAKTELAHLPGNLQVHKAIVKALSSLEDDQIKTEAFQVLKAQNAKLAPALKSLGTSAIPKDQKSAEDELDELAKAYAKEKDINFYDAYNKVADQNPELLSKAIVG